MHLLTRVAIGTGVAGAAFGILGAVLRPRAVVLPPSWTPRRDEPEVELEDWEAEALAGGEVSFDEDDGVLDDVIEGVVIGSGSPADLCVMRPRNPAAPAEICVLDPLADPRFRPVEGLAPLGERSAGEAEWPVKTKHRRRLVTSYWTADGIRGAWGREFGTMRTSEDGTKRRHVGVDLFANAEDVVVAPEKGRIVAILPFKTGTWAVYMRLPDDRILNLGEVEKLSWREFKVKPGQEVAKGQALARIGKMGSKSMLHVEMFDGKGITDEEITEQIRAGEMRWLEKQPPARVIDPSAYLVDAAARTYRADQDIT